MRKSHFNNVFGPNAPHMRFFLLFQVHFAKFWQNYGPGAHLSVWKPHRRFDKQKLSVYYPSTSLQLWPMLDHIVWPLILDNLTCRNMKEAWLMSNPICHKKAETCNLQRWRSMFSQWAVTQASVYTTKKRYHQNFSATSWNCTAILELSFRTLHGAPKGHWPKWVGSHSFIVGHFFRAGPTTTTTIFEFISRGPIFHFWGTLGWRTQCPFYTVEHIETTKIFHLMCHQVPFWCGIRCETFWENYGCGCVWAVPDSSDAFVTFWPHGLAAFLLAELLLRQGEGAFVSLSGLEATCWLSSAHIPCTQCANVSPHLHSIVVVIFTRQRDLWTRTASTPTTILGCAPRGHATTRFLEGFLEGSLKVGASWKGS